MRNLKRIQIFFLLISLVIFSACDRKQAESSTKLKFEFPATAGLTSSQSFQSLSVSATSTSSFTGPAAGSLADISCVFVLVGGPEVAMRTNTCEIQSSKGDYSDYFGLVVGGIPRGQSIEVSVPSGDARVITLVGFRSSTADYCPPLNSIDKTKLSDPYLLGVVGNLRLEPGATQEVPITLALDTEKYLKDCRGPDFGTRIGDKSDSVAEPDQIATFLPFSTSHINQSYCYPFSMELKKSGVGVQTATAKSLVINKTSNGILNTSLFAGVTGTSGNVNGTIPSVRFFSPRDIIGDSAGALYIADEYNNSIRKIRDGVATTLAGSPTAGTANGTGAAAGFNRPYGLALSLDHQYLYVSEMLNHSIRKIQISTGVVTTLAGTPGTSGYNNGAIGSALFNSPKAIAMGSDGNLYVADTLNQVIRKIDLGNSSVTTVAGVPGTAGFVDGAASSSQFNSPAGIAVDSSGNIFVSDVNNQRIRKISSGVVTTIAGSGSVGAANGSASSASFNYPGKIFLDSKGDLYIADTLNYVIRKLSAGSVSTFAGIVGSSGNVNSTALASTFQSPYATYINSLGHVFIVDSLAHTIRKIQSSSSSSAMQFFNTLSDCSTNAAGLAVTSFSVPAGQSRINGFFSTQSISGTAESFYFSDASGAMSSSASINYVVTSASGVFANSLYTLTSSGVYGNFYCIEATIYGYNTTASTAAVIAGTGVKLNPRYTGTGDIFFTSDCSSKVVVSGYYILSSQLYAKLGIWTNDLTSPFSGVVTISPSGSLSGPDINISLSH